MVKTSLVSSDIELGARILQVLDDAGLKPAVALWANLAEYEDWRIVLASPEFDELSKQYRLVFEALHRAGIPGGTIPTLVIFQMKDPFVRELRKHFGKAKDVGGMRLGGQVIGGRFVEDAYVYRIK